MKNVWIDIGVIPKSRRVWAELHEIWTSEKEQHWHRVTILRFNLCRPIILTEHAVQLKLALIFLGKGRSKKNLEGL